MEFTQRNYIMSDNQTNFANFFSSKNPSRIQEIFFYLFIIEAIIGIAGNSLSFCVMCRKQIRKTSTSVYLITMAVFDNLLLLNHVVIGTIGPLGLLDGQSLVENTYTCQFQTVLDFIPPMVSVWCLVAVTVERFLVVFIPHRSV